MIEKKRKKWLMWIAAALVLGVVVILGWRRYGANGESANLASGNGRIEATEIDVATKIAGRVKEVLVREGDFVTAGQVVARMDTEVLDAQLREAKAQMQEMRSTAATARSQLAQREAEKASAQAAIGQREAEKAAAQAVVGQREAELNVAKKRSARSSTLAAEGAMTQLEADDDLAGVQSGSAAVASARAQVAAADAAITAARAQVANADAAIVAAHAQIAGAESTIEAAQASVQRIQADITDSALTAPRDGRVQYRVAHPGEVLGAGGRVLNLVDLSDVYMTFFLPTAAAGRVALGSDIRLVLDAAPGFVIPAQAAFVSSVTQFTPKTVETESEREKLMFRIRAQISPDLLRRHITQVKTGLPGVAYVKLDQNAEWPPHLAVNVPQ
jgi:HlyD family secretion protein